MHRGTVGSGGRDAKGTQTISRSTLRAIYTWWGGTPTASTVARGGYGGASWDAGIAVPSAEGFPTGLTFQPSLQPLALSDLAITGRRIISGALLQRSTADPVWYATSARGGTDAPLDGNLVLESGYGAISRVYLSGTQFRFNDNSVTPDLGVYFASGGMGHDLQMHVMNDAKQVQTVTISALTIQSSGNNFVNFTVPQGVRGPDEHHRLGRALDTGVLAGGHDARSASDDDSGDDSAAGGGQESLQHHPDWLERLTERARRGHGVAFDGRAQLAVDIRMDGRGVQWRNISG